MAVSRWPSLKLNYTIKPQAFACGCMKVKAHDPNLVNASLFSLCTKCGDKTFTISTSSICLVNSELPDLRCPRPCISCNSSYYPPAAFHDDKRKAQRVVIASGISIVLVQTPFKLVNFSRRQIVLHSDCCLHLRQCNLILLGHCKIHLGHEKALERTDHQAAAQSRIALPLPLPPASRNSKPGGCLIEQCERVFADLPWHGRRWDRNNQSLNC